MQFVAAPACRSTQSAIYRCPRRPKGRSWPRNDLESGECRFIKIARSWRNAMNASPQLRPLGETLGTEALGIDLARLDDETFAWIRRAFGEHPVLVFREQKLGARDIATFGRRFGV